MRKITKRFLTVSVNFILLLMMVFPPVFFVGCLATSKEIVELRDDINQLRIKLQEVQINQADLTERMSSMDLSMSALGEKLEENKNAMSLVATRLDDIESGLSSKIGRLESRMESGFNRLSNDISKNVTARSSETPSPNVALPEEKSNNQSSPVINDSSVPLRSTYTSVSSEIAPSQPAKTTEFNFGGDISPGNLYRMAYDDFTSGRYESATATFKVFIEKYPTASLAPYAWYYMGESKYARSLYDGALEDFEYVIKNYPRSDMNLPALYKKAIILEKLNRPEDAKKIYSDIVKRYPSSQEANMSSERLKEFSIKKDTPQKTSPSSDSRPRETTSPQDKNRGQKE